MSFPTCSIPDLVNTAKPSGTSIRAEYCSPCVDKKKVINNPPCQCAKCFKFPLVYQPVKLEKAQKW